MPGKIFSAGVIASIMTCVAASVTLAAASGGSAIPPELAWAYPVAPPHTPELKAPTGHYLTPDKKRTLTAEQIDALNIKDTDWFPRSHPPAPSVIVSQGPDGAAPCAECHMINGQGVVGVPDLAGLPAAYLFGEIKAFRDGSRASSQSGRLATSVMIRVAKSWPDADLRAAVAYYASLPRRTPIHVVETETAPSLRVERFGWTYVDASHPQRQALKGAVAEAPESVARVFMYDPTDQEFVYVAKSTLLRGQSLVATGGGADQPCSGCHGANLRGGPVGPPLAGRDPSYLARQLWDIRSGARSGASAKIMRGPAEGLSARDITAIAAYLASLKP